MSRREFVRTAAAFSIGVWAINQVTGTRWGGYNAYGHNTLTNAACDLENPNAQLNNRPGEFIFDVQSHHVDPNGTWRVTNPAIEAFFAAIWPQAGGIGGGRRGPVLADAHPVPRGPRVRPDREPRPVPLPEGAVPRFVDQLLRAVGSTGRALQPAASDRRSRAHPRHGQGARRRGAADRHACVRDAEPRLLWYFDGKLYRAPVHAGRVRPHASEPRAARQQDPRLEGVHGVGRRSLHRPAGSSTIRSARRSAGKSSRSETSTTSRRSSPPTRASHCRDSTSALHRRATSAPRPERIPRSSSSSITPATTASPRARTPATTRSTRRTAASTHSSSRCARTASTATQLHAAGARTRELARTSTPKPAPYGAASCATRRDASHYLGKMIKYVGPSPHLLGHRQPLVRIAPVGDRGVQIVRFLARGAGDVQPAARTRGRSLGPAGQLPQSAPTTGTSTHT